MNDGDRTVLAIQSAEGKRMMSKRSTPGPKPAVLKIRGNWKNAVRQSLQKKKPAEGWPKEKRNGNTRSG